MVASSLKGNKKKCRDFDKRLGSVFHEFWHLFLAGVILRLN